MDSKLWPCPSPIPGRTIRSRDLPRSLHVHGAPHGAIGVRGDGAGDGCGRWAEDGKRMGGAFQAVRRRFVIVVEPK